MERAASVGSLLWILHPNSADPNNKHNHHHSSQRHLSPHRPRSELFHHPRHREQRSNTINHVTPKLIVTSHHTDGESEEEIVLNDHHEFSQPCENDYHEENESESSCCDEDQQTPCLEKNEDEDQTKVYKRRFYILFIFSLIAFMQYCCWNTFGPISTTCMEVFGWKESEIAIMASLDPITYIFTIYAFSWLMDTKGMRKAMLVTSFFMAFGTGLRCFTSNNEFATWTMAMGQFFNGLAGPVTQAGPPVISSLWFPANERTTATALASLTGSMGVAVSFLIGPSFVKEIPRRFWQKEIHDTNETLNHATELLFTSSERFIKNEDLFIQIQKHDNPKQQNTPSNENTTLTSDPVNLSDLLFTNCFTQPYSKCYNGITFITWINVHQISSRQVLLQSSAPQRRLAISVANSASERPELLITLQTSEIWTCKLPIKLQQWFMLTVTWHSKHGLMAYLNNTMAAQPIKLALPMATNDLTNQQQRAGRHLPKMEKIASLRDVMFAEKAIQHSDVVAIFLNKTRSDTERNELASIKQDRKSSIMNLLYIEFGINSFLFLCVVLYYPDKPTLPPSLSGHVERENFAKGLKLLMRNRQFWMLCLIYGLTTGVYSGWGAVLNVNLSKFGVTQKNSGWIGFYTVFAGVGAGMLLARFADMFAGRMKLLLLFLLTGASAFFLWFALLCLRIITFSKESLYQAAIFGGFFISGTIPIFYELTIEQTYPVAEGTTTGLLTLINNIVTVLFLVVLIIPNVGTLWMNWVLFGSCVICLPILIFLKTKYNRLHIDIEYKNNGHIESENSSEELNIKLDSKKITLLDDEKNSENFGEFTSPLTKKKSPKHKFKLCSKKCTSALKTAAIPSITRIDASLWSVEHNERNSIYQKMERERAD